jgi:hypothetical protein
MKMVRLMLTFYLTKGFKFKQMVNNTTNSIGIYILGGWWPPGHILRTKIICKTFSS